MKRNHLGKIFLVLALLVGLFALGRGMFYFDNDEAQGLSLVSGDQIAQVNGGHSPTEAELPSRLVIPKLEVDADVQRLGVTETGNMAAPNNFTDVSWYKFGTVPGYKGSAVMAGHEDNAISLDGVFKHLADLEIGDDVYVVREDGKRLHYRVVDEQTYRFDDPAPLTGIFNKADGSYLNLITCAGEWLASAKTNDHRLVIYTKLVE